MNYDRKMHAARSTNDYVFSQLIPYIGSKRKLLPLIQDALNVHGVRAGSFFDAFAGSGVVSRLAKSLGYEVVSNDWEPYAKTLNQCWIALDEAPQFRSLGGYESAISLLNSVPDREDWVAQHLCPKDDDDWDVDRERLFFMRKNGLRIDAIRLQIEDWHQSGAIDNAERDALLAPLLYATCYVSNTSGVFKGFHNGWGGSNGTATYRICSRLEMRPATFIGNGHKHRIYAEDATKLARDLAIRERFEVTYLDPPYNQHPYGSNYHVLNTVALWDKPQLTRTIQGRNKSAIRLDWRKLRRSAYNHSNLAAAEYGRLLQALRSRIILTSYSTDGTIPLLSLVNSACERGQTTAVMKPYKRYRVSSQRFSKKPMNVEFILVTNTETAHATPAPQQIVSDIRNCETAAVDHHPEGQDVPSLFSVR